MRLRGTGGSRRRRRKRMRPAWHSRQRRPAQAAGGARDSKTVGDGNARVARRLKRIGLIPRFSRQNRGLVQKHLAASAVLSALRASARRMGGPSALAWRRTSMLGDTQLARPSNFRSRTLTRTGAGTASFLPVCETFSILNRRHWNRPRGLTPPCCAGLPLSRGRGAKASLGAGLRVPSPPGEGTAAPAARGEAARCGARSRWY